MSYWLENAPHSESKDYPHILLDLGYVESQATRDRADKIMAAMRIGRKNLELAANNRLLMRLPPAKVQATLEHFPEIKPGPGYCWTSFHWLSEDAICPSTDESPKRKRKKTKGT